MHYTNYKSYTVTKCVTKGLQTPEKVTKCPIMANTGPLKGIKMGVWHQKVRAKYNIIGGSGGKFYDNTRVIVKRLVTRLYKADLFRILKGCFI